MSVRDKGYESYGFTDKEVNELLNNCRSRVFHKNELLMQCCVEVKEEIARDIYYSITSGLSYEKLTYLQDIPMPKVDFYGYRRKALALFKERYKE